MGAFWAGLLLGLSMILPIGPQNLFVLQSGFVGGLRRGLIGAATAGMCDTALILVGAGGVSAILAGAPALRFVLLGAGVVFLLALGIASLRAAPATSIAETEAGPYAPPSPVRQIATGVGVSWGNPHAILDTVAVIGSTIAAQQATARLPFTAGTVTASWSFFLALAVTGGVFGARLPAAAQVWIRRGSGVIMLVFALVLALEAARSLSGSR